MSKPKHAKRSKEQPAERVEGAATGIVRYQLGNAKDEIEKLQAQNKALKAELGRDPDELLVALAQCLFLAREASDARKAWKPDESGVRQHSDSQPIPGQPTANQRWFSRRLLRVIRRDILDFTIAKERNWPQPPLITRCRNRDCSRLDKWLPAYEERGSNEFCAGCGNRLPKALTTADFA